MALRVAVIGAGAAGLCAARHILSKPQTFSAPVVFESGPNIGGTWVYEEPTKSYSGNKPVHSSMYRDLRTNLPKEVMMFPDFPFDPELDSFLPHQEVLRYLEKYCDHFKISPHIQFNTVVKQVRPIVRKTGTRMTEWEVTSSDRTGLQRTERFDAIFVCSGHYSDPHFPEIPGIQHFKGEVLHSHSYRSPERFSGQTALVLGARASGIDISHELCTVAAQVFLSHRQSSMTFPLPQNLHQTPPIHSIQQDGTVLLEGGRVVNPDVLLLCTGYNFSFPFLSEAELGIRLEPQFVGPLYRQLLPPSFPSIFFIGICQQICPFPHFHCQVQYCLSVLEGTVVLPSVEDMEHASLSWVEDRLRRGVPQRHLLRLEREQWGYCHALACAANVNPINPVVRSLYEEVWRQRREHPLLYRGINYRLLSEDEWERREER